MKNFKRVWIEKGAWLMKNKKRISLWFLTNPKDLMIMEEEKGGRS